MKNPGTDKNSQIINVKIQIKRLELLGYLSKRATSKIIKLINIELEK